MGWMMKLNLFLILEPNTEIAKGKKVKIMLN